jgi:hypothetical protein
VHCVGSCLLYELLVGVSGHIGMGWIGWIGSLIPHFEWHLS